MSDFATPDNADSTPSSDEPTHFTPWLARNVDVLGGVLGLDLTVLDDPDDDLLNGVHIEVDLGGYFLDIMATDAAGRTVAIENQYGNGDHRHLGQLLTYASGVGADVLIWLAESFSDAHLETLRWLNERTDDRCGVFGVRARFMRIGDSPAAPIFELAVGPSEWARIQREVVNATENWTLESFLAAVEADRETTNDLFEWVASTITDPAQREALWFGARPGGSVYLHPRGRRYAPAYVWANAHGRAMISGAWNNYGEPATRHPAYGHVAAVRGQDHMSSATGVPLGNLDFDVLCAALDRTADELATSLGEPPQLEVEPNAADAPHK